jgi:hypothetical protein
VGDVVAKLGAGSEEILMINVKRFRLMKMEVAD